jgi:hypothetical protein
MHSRNTAYNMLAGHHFYWHDLRPMRFRELEKAPAKAITTAHRAARKFKDVVAS